jgi:hypothetical protein
MRAFVSAGRQCRLKRRFLKLKRMKDYFCRSKILLRKLTAFAAVIITAASIAAFPAGAAQAAGAAVTVRIGRFRRRGCRRLLVDGTAFVPLRAFCTAMDEAALVSWDENSRTAYASTSRLKLSVRVGDKYLVANGRYLYLNKPCYIGAGRSWRRQGAGKSV